MSRAQRAAEQAFTRLAEATKLTPKQLTARLEDETTVLERVELDAVKAEAQRDEAVSRAADLRDNATETRSNAKAATKQAAERERGIRSSMHRLAKTCAGMRARAAKLPELVRPVVADEAALDLSATPEERRVGLGAARVNEGVAKVRVALVELRGIEANGATAREEREVLDEQLQDLRARWKY